MLSLAVDTGEHDELLLDLLCYLGWETGGANHSTSRLTTQLPLLREQAGRSAIALATLRHEVTK